MFPQEICATPLKVDGFIISKSRRLCILVELTAPMEHNIQKWHQSKLKKYESELCLEAERNGWKLHCLVLEVGARGWIPPSVISGLRLLGTPAFVSSSVWWQLEVLTSFGLIASTVISSLSDSEVRLLMLSLEKS